MKIHFVFQDGLWRFAARLLLMLALWTCTGLSLHVQADTPDLPEEFRNDAGGKLVLIDFYSQFCGTCLMMEPHLADLKAKTGDKVLYQRVDISISGNEKYVDAFDIQGTPTYVLFNADGKAIYRMGELVSPAILEKQVLRAAGNLKQVAFPSEISLPQTAAISAGGQNDLILVSLENADCTACKRMIPYLSGFEQTQEEGLHILHLDTATPGGKQMMKDLAIKSLPAYVLFDNNQSVGAVPVSKVTKSSRGELFRVEGEVKPLILWDLIKVFAQPGV